MLIGNSSSLKEKYLKTVSIIRIIKADDLREPLLYLLALRVGLEDSLNLPTAIAIAVTIAVSLAIGVSKLNDIFKPGVLKVGDKGLGSGLPTKGYGADLLSVVIDIALPKKGLFGG
ncbi:hypothetical protein G6O67_002276 [Ophiocordyceps sinensis]|uniref:Uncharacterized protein n=1 Tax=Ophiocordyceps sinensis TaxID=72228 RepID=A0A8H4PTZ9_9HYPO|nr:hypothetical protein G6O67_002276 [Ophiocordyceps sinensis]